MRIDWKNPWLWGGAAVVLVGGWYFLYSPGTASADDGSAFDTSAALGSIALSPPIASGGSGGTTTGDNSASSIDALLASLDKIVSAGPSEAVQLAQINANHLNVEAKQGASVFNSLIKSLNAHVGLGGINAIIPGLTGPVRVWFGNPKPKPKPKPKTKA